MIKVCYVYYDYEDFASSCDPIRMDLVIDDVCIKSRSSYHYMEYRDIVNDYVIYCEDNYKDDDMKINHVCVRDGDESYTFK